MSVINRRRFFSGLLAAGALPVSTLPAKKPNTWDEEITIGPYRVHWTGWKASTQTNFLVGQWLAWPVVRPTTGDEPPYLYLSVPGMIGGPYLPGCVFNISNHDVVVTDETTEDERAVLIDQGYNYMLQLVDRFREVKWGTLRGMPYYRFPDALKDGRLRAAL